VLAGATTLGSGGAYLTADIANLAGALWWNAPYTFDSFDVSATFVLQAKPSGADGVVFAWVPGSNVNQTGCAANCLGNGLLGGWGVAIDTYQNPGEPAAPFLAIVDATAYRNDLARAVIPNVRDGAPHVLRVLLTAGKVSAWIDNVNYFSDFALPSYAPFTGHWGFAAATGGASETHFVQNITMTFPDGQGCVP
jgi:hypothetical protein